MKTPYTIEQPKNIDIFNFLKQGAQTTKANYQTENYIINEDLFHQQLTNSKPKYNIRFSIRHSDNTSINPNFNSPKHLEGSIGDFPSPSPKYKAKV